MFFDSHAHYDDKKFHKDRSSLLSSMQANNVSNIINVGADVSSSIESIALAQQYDFMFSAVGVHPHSASEMTPQTIELLEGLAKKDKVVAIGEIGLDYFHNHSPVQQQQHWFREQLKLAKKLHLPVIIHDRDAHEHCMDIIKEFLPIRGVFHCFAGSEEMAKIVLGWGFYISIAGPVTFNNAVRCIPVVKGVPIDRLLIETDCPYLAPEPMRGKRNDSTFIKYTAQKIADIKGMSVESLAERTADNAKRLFGLQ